MFCTLLLAEGFAVEKMLSSGLARWRRAILALVPLGRLHQVGSSRAAQSKGRHIKKLNGDKYCLFGGLAAGRGSVKHAK